MDQRELVIQMLEKNDLRKTAVRMQMLEIFVRSSHAVTASSLEESLRDFDRVTVYRTLQTFLEKSILHKIPDESGSPRYALLKNNDAPASHPAADHVHFKCTVCGLTRCIDDIPVPMITLPAGYVAAHVNYVVQGVCVLCSGQLSY